jgi:hypothetical protein
LAAKLTAIDFSFAAEILDQRRFGDKKNSQEAGCSSAVIGYLVN